MTLGSALDIKKAGRLTHRMHRYTLLIVNSAYWAWCDLSERLERRSVWHHLTQALVRRSFAPRRLGPRIDDSRYVGESLRSRGWKQIVERTRLVVRVRFRRRLRARNPTALRAALSRRNA